MTTITVYTKPNCVQCDMTKRWLTKHGHPHTTIDLTQDPTALAAVQALGYMAAPVVVVRDKNATTDVHWSGFQPAMLGEHIEEKEAEA